MAKCPGPPGHEGPCVEAFESGAVRQKLDDVRYDLISPFGLRRLAMTCAAGAKKYNDHNWRKGMPFSVLLNHIMEHITLYLAGENGEDHLAHAAWGLFAMMEFEETRPELDDLYEYGEVGLDPTPSVTIRGVTYTEGEPQEVTRDERRALARGEWPW